MCHKITLCVPFFVRVSAVKRMVETELQGEKKISSCSEKESPCTVHSGILQSTITEHMMGDKKGAKEDMI